MYVMDTALIRKKTVFPYERFPYVRTVPTPFKIRSLDASASVAGDNVTVLIKREAKVFSRRDSLKYVVSKSICSYRVNSYGVMISR